ncbi:MAG: response regulator transcription factor [Oligoflexia bacterium]|nr:response regulator transcription factor [Oligoflexia bacterium]
MTILLIESDPRTKSYLVNALAGAGFKVESVLTEEELEMRMSFEDGICPNCIVLDQVFKGKDSVCWISKLKNYWQCPLLVVSPYDSSHEKSEILDSGADDCISRPFSLEELISRIRALIRRSANRKGNHWILGNTKIDEDRQSVLVNNTRIDISHKEFQLLRKFVEKPGKVFSRYVLLDQVWDIHRDTESNVVEATIKNLRKKLHLSQSTILIESRRNIGYWVESQKESPSVT